MFVVSSMVFKRQQVGGAALDVFEQEPPTDPLTLKIIQHPAVIATPHLGKFGIHLFYN